MVNNFQKDKEESNLNEINRAINELKTRKEEYKPVIHEANYKDLDYSKFDMHRHKIPPIIEWSILIIIVIIISIITSFFFINKLSTVNCGFDSECFLKNANQCKPSNLRLVYVDNTIIQYTSTRDCVLEKEIISFDENEPDLLVHLLSEKKMFCSYNYNEFNETWIEDLYLSIDECSGELKEAILELLVYIEIAEMDEFYSIDQYDEDDLIYYDPEMQHLYYDDLY